MDTRKKAEQALMRLKKLMPFKDFSYTLQIADRQGLPDDEGQDFVVTVQRHWKEGGVACFLILTHDTSWPRILVHVAHGEEWIHYPCHPDLEDDFIMDIIQTCLIQVTAKYNASHQ